MPNSKASGVAYEDPQFESLAVSGDSALTGALTVGGNSKLGDAATDLVGFHGSTGTSQTTFVATQSVNALSVSGVVGFSSSAALSNALGLLNALQAAMVNHGLMASS